MISGGLNQLSDVFSISRIMNEFVDRLLNNWRSQNSSVLKYIFQKSTLAQEL